MDKTQFTENELHELEALEIRGGGDIANPLVQIECVNEAIACGAGGEQLRCLNKVTGCGGESLQICPPKDPQFNCPSVAP